MKPVWITAGAASVFAATYTVVAVDPPGVTSLFIAVAPVVSAALWMRRDARLHRVAVVFDWGLFVYIAWPVLIPWYVLHTRGRAGWPLLLGLFLAILAPFVTAVIVAAVWDLVLFPEV